MTLISTTGLKNQNTAFQGILSETFLSANYAVAQVPFGVLGLSGSVTGTGSSCSGGWDVNNFTLLFLGTGTTATGRAGIVSGFGISVNNINSSVTLETSIRIPTLSTGTQTFSIFFGLANTTTSAFTNGVQFSISGSSIQGISRNNSTSTNTTSSTIVANTWYPLKIILGFDYCDFFINNSLLQRVTTNVPSGKNLGINLFILKSLGTTQASCSVKSIKLSWLYR